MYLLKIYGRDKEEHVEIKGNYGTTLQEGDNVVINAPSKSVSAFIRKGTTLVVQLSQDLSLTLEQFLLLEKSNVETVITFTDTLFTASELEATFSECDNQAITLSDLMKHQKNERFNVLTKSGTLKGQNKLKAYNEKPFIYHFTLAEDIPENASVKILVGGELNPDWLTLKQISTRHYMITGVPGEKHIGTKELTIKVEV